MNLSDAGLHLIAESEGCKLKAYPDPGSKDGKPWTIGFGHTGPDVHAGLVWSMDQALAALRRDASVTASRVLGLLGGVKTTQGQFDALVDFAYNLGIEALRTSTLLRKHKAGDFAGAANEFGRWINNDGRPMRGLITRRAKDRAMYLS